MMRGFEENLGVPVRDGSCPTPLLLRMIRSGNRGLHLGRLAIKQRTAALDGRAGVRHAVMGVPRGDDANGDASTRQVLLRLADREMPVVEDARGQGRAGSRLGQYGAQMLGLT